MRTRRIIISELFLLAGLVGHLIGPVVMVEAANVQGTVRDAMGVVSGAGVRVRATEWATLSASDGTYILEGLPEGEELEITAWADGYYVANTHAVPPASGVDFLLRPYHREDHPDYEWVSPETGSSETACANCHPMIVSQWSANAHGTAVSNPRFFSLYNGTDLSGTVAVAPGYRLDFPGTAGSCANCHAPAAAADAPFTTDMNAARGQVTAGIHCDYCHKTGGVYVNPATRSVYRNVPGVQSQRLLRPPAGEDIFFGPYDDIHEPDTRLPLISESAFCAPCHQFSFWGTPIYESYDEWLASPYAERNVTCQDCHMPPTGETLFALPEAGGLEHPAERIPSHLQRGASDDDLLQNTVTLGLEASEWGDYLIVTGNLENTGAGHHVPTDFPGRQMILSLRAETVEGGLLLQHTGPRLPSWCGELQGVAGKAYAKLLRDAQSGETPVVSYWKQTLIAMDNRLPALGQDRLSFVFAKPASGGRVRISAEVILRRAFKSLMDQRAWDRPDRLMESANLVTEPLAAPGSDPGPDLKACEGDSACLLGEDTPVSVIASLNMPASYAPGPDAAQACRWYLGVHTSLAAPYDWFSYVEGQGWRLGVLPFREGPAFAMEPLELVGVPLPAGSYTFFFGSLCNGRGITDGTLLDLVDVHVSPAP